LATVTIVAITVVTLLANGDVEAAIAAFFVGVAIAGAAIAIVAVAVVANFDAIANAITTPAKLAIGATARVRRIGIAAAVVAGFVGINDAVAATRGCTVAAVVGLITVAVVALFGWPVGNRLDDVNDAVATRFIGLAVG